MKELAKSNDPVFLSWAQSVLGDAGVPCYLFDSHMSVLDGSIGILPRRLMVSDDDLAQAQRLLEEAAPPEEADAEASFESGLETDTGP